jgi:hypothetical protein
VKEVRKVLSGVLALVLVVSLAGCSLDNDTKVTDDNKTTQGMAVTEVYEQARKLGDEVLNYYLGKDYDTAYTGFIYDAGIGKVTSENKTIYLPDQAASRVLYGLQLGAYYMSVLKYEQEIRRNEASGGESMVDSVAAEADELLARMDSSMVALLDEYIFVDGKIPDLAAFDADLNITPDFTQWFIYQAQQAGVLDRRLSFIHGQKTELTVESKDCGPSSGGLTFNVLEETYEIPANEVGVTADDVSTSPNFVMDIESYRFYNTGIYTVNYATKPSDKVTQRHRITISFKYIEPTGDFSDDLSKFLAGVRDFKLIHK